MKKKLMMVTVLLGALAFGACVDDNESASVTAVREAKAKQLTALATKAEAEAEAALISANAEKAYKEALVKYQEALTKQEEATTEQIQEQIRQSKEKFDAEIEAIKAEYEQRMWEAKRKSIIAEQAFLDEAETRLQALYLAYSSAAEELSDLKQLKADEELNLVRMQAYALKIDEYIGQKTAEYEAQIKEKEASIAAWQKYSGLDKNELNAQLEDLKQDKYTAFSAWEAANAALEPAETAWNNLRALYDYNSSGISTVKAVAAVQHYLSNGYEFVFWDAADWNEAYQILSYAQQAGYVANSVWINQMDGRFFLSAKVATTTYEYVPDLGRYVSVPIAPIATEYINIIENVNTYYNQVPVYSISNLTKDGMTKFYANNVENTKQYLGEEATATTEATGLYKTLADAQKTLTDAQAALPAKEADAATAEAKVKEMQALVDAARLDVDKAQAAVNTIYTEIEGYQKEKEAAQREINAADLEKSVAYNKKADATHAKTVAESNKTAAEAAKTAAEADLAAATTDAEKAAAQARIDVAKADIATATAMIARADKQIKEADDAIKAADATIEAEQAKQKAADDKIAAANLKLADAREVLSAANRVLNKVKTELDVANNELWPLNSDVANLKAQIDAAEKAVAAAKDNIENAKKDIENNDKYLALWNDVVAALTADYEAEVKALATNELVAAYVKAYQAFADAQTAYNEIGNKIGALTTLINSSDVYDAAAEIKDLELAIASLKKNIEELKHNYSVGGQNADAYERLIAYSKAEIEELEGKIEIQTKVVELAKKRVDDYIASQK